MGVGMNAQQLQGISQLTNISPQDIANHWGDLVAFLLTNGVKPTVIMAVLKIRNSGESHQAQAKPETNKKPPKQKLIPVANPFFDGFIGEKKR